MQASIDPLTGGLIFNNPDEEFSQQNIKKLIKSITTPQS